MTYIEIQNDVIQKYRVKLNPDSTCWRRTHAHVKTRTVCKWKQRNSLRSTFTLLHEVGHIMTTKGNMRRAESEFHATLWALERCMEYHLVIPYELFKDYQDYIDEEMDRGLRRGGKGYGNLSLRTALGMNYACVVN